MKQVALLILFGLVAAEAAKWYETAAFYQIYPQSFYDDGSGKAGTGTLKGILSKLDHFEYLGIDALWLTPIFKSSTLFSAYGYDIIDYTDIDPRYGSLADFDALITAVHAKKMKIIVDFVPNHCGFEHEYFNKSINNDEEYKDWFVWTNETNYSNGTDEMPSNWQRIGGEPGSGWHFDETRKEFFYSQFYHNMPDLNLRNDKVREYLQGVMKFWLDKEIDGFRIDAISHGYESEPNKDTGKYINENVNPAVEDPEYFGHLIHSETQDQPELFELIYSWREFLDGYTNKEGDERIMMTESYSPSDVIKKYYGSGTKNGSHLPFNFQMINAIKANSTADDFVKMVTDWLEKVVPEGKVTNWVIGNHDQPRVASRFGKDRIDIMNMLVQMLPGTSVTYYGEEIGMADSCAVFQQDHNVPAKKCDDPEITYSHSDAWVRSVMQWDNTTNAGFSTSDTTWIPAGDDYENVNVKAQKGVAGSHLEIHKALLKLRKNEAIMSSNTFEIKTLNTNSFAFKRELTDKKKQSIVVFVNFGNATEKVDIKKVLKDMPDLMTVELTGGQSAYKQGQQINTGEFDLGKFESVVAFYNNSAALAISKIAFMLLIAVCVFIAKI